jgi:hypothetical protein
MKEKTDPHLICNSDNTTVSIFSGYSPTRREFFAALALPHVANWVNKFDFPETMDLKKVIAVAAVDIADELIKALDGDNETD